MISGAMLESLNEIPSVVLYQNHKWVGLTEEDLQDLYATIDNDTSYLYVIQKVEAKLKEKNLE